jgi:hypothetical protein
MADPQAGANYLNNALGYPGLQSYLFAAGYGGIANLTASAGDANLILNDSRIGALSGQVGQNAALNYFTDTFGRGGATSTDAAGVAASAGLGDVNQFYLNQLGQLGVFGSRPPGTGSGSPFIDSLGPPVGTNPQDRTTYDGGYGVTSPLIASLGPPVGYQPLGDAFQTSTASYFGGPTIP